jgi:HEAT repeat protein
MQPKAELFGVRPRVWVLMALMALITLAIGVVYLSHQLTDQALSINTTAQTRSLTTQLESAKTTAPPSRQLVIRTDNSSTNAAQILQNLSDPDSNIRLHALNQMAALKLEIEDVLPLLIACLHDSEARVRAEAALHLGTLGMPANDAVAVLKQVAFTDTNDLVRSRAKDALYNIRFYDFGQQDF